MPNTAHILQFTLCELWFRPYTKYLQLSIFRLQYSAAGIIAAFVDITTFLCELYCKLGVKYSAHPPVYAMWTVDPAIYKVLVAPDIQTSIFIWTYLRCYCTYNDNSMHVILQTWCQIQHTSSSLRCVDCGPVRIQRIYSSAYLCFIIQLQVSAAAIVDITTIQCSLYSKIVPNTAHILQFTLCELWSRPFTKYL
jgi:hypothetical protein